MRIWGGSSGRQLSRCYFLCATHLFELKCHLSVVPRKGRGHMSNHGSPVGWKSLLPGAWDLHAVDSSNVTTASRRLIIPVCLRAIPQPPLCLQSLGGFLWHFSSCQMNTGLGIGKSFSHTRSSMFIPFLSWKQCYKDVLSLSCPKSHS